MNVVPLLLALALTSPGAPKSAKWVALVSASAEVPAAWQDALRKAAEDAKDGRAWVDPPAVTLEEAQAVLGCAQWGPACAGQIAQMTGANTALLVELKPAGAGILLSAEAVNENGQMARVRQEVVLADASADSLRFAQAWVKGALTDRLPALLVVETATPGAEVSLDGKRVGTTDQGPLRIIVEAPGTHTLLVTKEGAAPVTRSLSLAPNATVTELVALAAEAPPVDPKPRLGDPSIITPPTPKPTQPPAIASTTGAVVGWSLTGVGGVFALASGIVAATVANDLYAARVSCGEDGGKLCVPQLVKSPIGLYEYQGAARETFFEADGPLYLTLAGVGVGVGALLAGTGAWLALGDSMGPPPTGE